MILDDRWPEADAIQSYAVVGRLADAARWVADGYRLIMGIANARQLGIRNEVAARVAVNPVAVESNRDDGPTKVAGGSRDEGYDVHAFAARASRLLDL